MCDSLEEQINRDDQATSTPRDRWLRHAEVMVITMLLFGGLYAGIRLLG